MDHLNVHGKGNIDRIFNYITAVGLSNDLVYLLNKKTRADSLNC